MSETINPHSRKKKKCSFMPYERYL